MEPITALHQSAYDDRPVMLLFGDRPEGLRAADIAARGAGARIADALPLAEACARLEEQAAVDLVLLQVAEDHGPMLDGLLAKLDDAAATGRHGSIVMLDRALIDIVTARITHESVSLLCDANEIEGAGAIGAALATQRARLHDIGSDGGTLRLKQLSEEVGRIARTLASLSGTEAVRVDAVPGAVLDRRQTFTTAPSAGGEAALVRSIIRARRMRDQFFPMELFADPAWDMLLDLMAARLEGRAVAVSSLCIAAAVPPTTALRWIKTMTDAGLFVRVADPRDGRRVFIELSEGAAEGLTAFLAAVRRAGAMPI